MKQTIDVPPGFLPVWLDGGGLLVIPVAVYVAGLKLGKRLRRRAALAKREKAQGSEAGEKGTRGNVEAENFQEEAKPDPCAA